ncbi:MAG: NAD-dependent protein deacylase [Chloroflexi bacterium]|nr:MAG: NAD-dependent protein deacylase [Chloroflexota bacterium]
MTEMGGDLAREIRRAADLMLSAEYVVASTGAGISVESGIRPFRGPGGLWTEYGEPPMDGYQRFLDDPKREWQRMINREGYLKGLFDAFERAEPNAAHYAMAELERMGILKCVITQNVDNLHRAAGSQNVAEVHGNFLLVRCINCSSRYPREEVSLEELPPRCPKCGGIVKNDGVYFGEPIPADVLQKCQEEVSRCDCMLLVGTSGFVFPAAGFPRMVKRNGGCVIEVGPYETDLTHSCDVVLRGRGAEVMPRLVEEVKSQVRLRQS